MKENELDVLSQYDMEVNGTRRVRGAVLCDTKQGPFLLRELSFSARQLPDLYELYNYLKEQGCANVDELVKNKDGGLVSESESGTKYILKKWFYGRECDSKRETDILDSVRNLACLHHVMQWKLAEIGHMREPLDQEFFRHNRELKKVRAFMRARSVKGEFEAQFLNCFDGMFEWAECAKDKLKKAEYTSMLQKSYDEGRFVHGDYNYHNLILLSGQIATTGFEHFYIGIQMDDLYYFIRKIMEKNQWNIQLGHRMLDQYHRVLPLADEQLEYLAIRIAYPEKFWKLANTYNRSSKAWMSAKTVEKLDIAVRQTQEKKQFLESLFSFSLY